MAEKENGAQFVRYFGPVLDALRGLGGSGRPDEVIEQIARDQGISDAVQNELTPSGELRYPKQVHWARFYLVREGLIDSSRRGIWSLTERGRVTQLSHSQAREIFLKRVKFDQELRKARSPETAAQPDTTSEPADAEGCQHRTAILEVMQSLPASGFERLAQRLLREAGFVEVIVTGKSGDGGIDGYGTLQINPLVSFKVLFQCKKYKDSVSPSVIRDFRGAMAGRADKGIIITTGTFTTEARREASRDGAHPIELVDGGKLVDMLEQLELGLTPVRTFKVDQRFFDEFRG